MFIVMKGIRFGCAFPIQEHANNCDVVVCAPTVSVIEGAEVYDTVCPVNKFTGHRESPFKLLGKLTGAKADLLNAVLQELPAVVSDSRLTDEDRVNYVVERLSTGTPAEDSLMAQRIMNDIDALGLRSSSVDDVKDAISFDKSDAPDVSSES